LSAAREPSIALAAVAVEGLGEGSAELVTLLAPISPSASIAEERPQLRLRTDRRSRATMHERVRPAQRHAHTTDEGYVDERPRIARAAHATGISKAFGHRSSIAPV
jgi:hypothetical protein